MLREEATPAPAMNGKSEMQLDPAPSDGIPSLNTAAQLRLATAVAVPVCAFALLWNLSVAHYYLMASDPAERASFITPTERVIQHLFLLPLLTGGYFLATLPAASAWISRTSRTPWIRTHGCRRPSTIHSCTPSDFAPSSA